MNDNIQFFLDYIKYNIHEGLKNIFLQYKMNFELYMLQNIGKNSLCGQVKVTQGRRYVFTLWGEGRFTLWAGQIYSKIRWGELKTFLWPGSRYEEVHSKAGWTVWHFQANYSLFSFKHHFIL